jgi:hypothetical protein
MQVRGLLIAVGVLALLSAGVWWSNKNPQDTTKKEPGEGKRENLVNLLQADLVEVKVTRKGEAPLVLRNTVANNDWAMVLDPPLPTSSQEAMEVVTNAVTMNSNRVVEENATDLIQYGLEPAQITLDLKAKDGKTAQILIGDQTPVGNMFYARRAGEKKVFAIGQDFKIGVDRGVNDLRDKRLMAVNEAKLSRIEIVKKSESLDFTRTARGLWQMVKPQAYRTESTVLDELINKAKEANFDPTLSAEELKKNTADFASAALVATLKVVDGGAAKQLEIRKTKEEAFLGKSSVVDGVFKIADDFGKSFDKSLDDYRSKRLMDFGYEDPVRIDLNFVGKKSVVERKDKDWILNGKKVEAATLMPFLDALRAFSALKFVPSGFTTAASSVSVTQKDGKTVEKLLLAKVGNFLYAKREGEAGEYEIDPKTLADLEDALGKVKEPGAVKK